MTKLTGFALFGRYGVIELSGNRPVGFFTPAFQGCDHANLFIAWLEDWRRTNAFWPSTDQQIACAERIAEYMAPILAVFSGDVMTPEELLAGFLDSEPGRQLRKVAA